MKNRTMKPSAQKAYQHFLDNPGAKPMKVAKRFKLSAPYAYKLRDKAAGNNPAKKIQRPAPVRTVSIEEIFAPVSLETTLGSRGKVYGSFRDNACLAQALKRSMADHAQDLGKTFADDQWEALEMISTKISRIVTGDADNIDQWHDIAGYATLIADRLRGLVR